MKLWLASTEAEFVASHTELGLFEGILTNPTTVAATRRPAKQVIRDLCAATSRPVFYQLKAASADEMRRQSGSLLSEGWINLGIKVPMTREGCAVLAWLRDQKVGLRLATAVPTTVQVLLAVALEVPWITPAGSVLEKLGGPAKSELLVEMQNVIDQQRSASVLVPSLASPSEMRRLALSGLRAGFVWDRDVNQFLDQKIVREAVSAFEPAWKEMRQLGESSY
jgi:transaldolase